jgi:hypothetical protein
VDRVGQLFIYNNCIKVSTAVHGKPKASLLPLFHGGNRGSNPLGDAIKINQLVRSTSGGVLEVCRTYPIPGDSAIFLSLARGDRSSSRRRAGCSAILMYIAGPVKAGAI